MKKSFYKRYTKDFLLNTVVMGMTLEEEGAYNRLLDIWWHEGGKLPNDNVALAKLVGKGCTEQIIKNIKICFVPDNDNLVVPLLSDQLPKKKEKIEISENFLRDECLKCKDEFPVALIKEFFNYWSEPFVKGAYKGKQRWQGEDTWDTKKRLNTWLKNDLKFNSPAKGQQAPTDNKVKGSIQDKIKRQNERE